MESLSARREPAFPHDLLARDDHHHRLHVAEDRTSPMHGAPTPRGRARTAPPDHGAPRHVSPLPHPQFRQLSYRTPRTTGLGDVLCPNCRGGAAWTVRESRPLGQREGHLGGHPARTYAMRREEPRASPGAAEGVTRGPQRVGRFRPARGSSSVAPSSGGRQCAPIGVQPRIHRIASWLRAQGFEAPGADREG